MINAKDIFHLEREMLYELHGLVYQSDMSSSEKGEIFERLNEDLTEGEFNALKNTVLERQSTALTRIKNGETMSAKEISEAVKQAANE